MKPLVAMLAVLVALSRVDAQSGAEDEARRIIEKAIKAHGGEENIAKQKTLRIRYTGVGDLYGVPNARFTLENHWQFPSQFRSVLKLTAATDITRTIVYSGSTGWLTVNGMTVPMAAEDLATAREQLYIESLEKLLPFPSKEHKLALLAESKVNGKPALGVRVSHPQHQDVELYFDRSSHLLLKMSFTIANRNDKTPQEVIYGSYRQVDGIKRPMAVAVFQDSVKIMEMQVSDVQYPSRLDERLFARP